MEYLATFYTHVAAIKYYKIITARGITAETMPVPRRFSSSCGIGVKFVTRQDIRNLIFGEVEKIFQLGDNEKLIYDSETV